MRSMKSGTVRAGALGSRPVETWAVETRAVETGAVLATITNSLRGGDGNLAGSGGLV
jgi:hypothetical protein